MRAPALALLALALAGCAAPEESLLFSLHLAHDFEAAPRSDGFEVGPDATLLRAHLQLSAKERDASCEGSDARIVLVDPHGEATELAPRGEACAQLLEPELEATPGPWLVRFEGSGPLLGGVDVVGARSSGGFRLAR